MIDYLLAFALAGASVGLWTLRVALTARGLRVGGSLVATFEAVVFVLAFSHVLGSLETPGRIVVYGLGVGAGTFTGLSIDSAIKRERPPTTTETDQLKGTEMKTRQRRRIRRQQTTDPIPASNEFDLRIEEIFAQLAYPSAIGVDGTRNGDRL